MAGEGSRSFSGGVGVSFATLSSLSSFSSGVMVQRNSKRAIKGAGGRGAGGRGVFELIDNDDEVQFDTSDTDNNREVLKAGKQYSAIQEFASAIPNHLLLGSLLEHLCFVYEQDPAQSRMLFKVIGQRLAAMKLLSPLAISDEFSSVRLQHSRVFSELLRAASSSLFPQDHRYLSAECQNPVLSHRTKDVFFQAQTSRYLSEFDELSTLGKGSYGKVFKVQNKLDGQEYAIKKILIKNVTRSDCMKVLREVKVLSSLQHPNIVGYHTAWMEHVQPAVSNPKSMIAAIPALEASSHKRLDQERSKSTSGSSIVFESSECSVDRKPHPMAMLKSRSEAVCLKSVRNSQNVIPCVVLGKSRSALDSCTALHWKNSSLSKDEPSLNGPEFNNNSYVDMSSQRLAEKHQNEVQFHLMLYIQMQLCERSLKDWIQERNSRPQPRLTTRSTDVYPSQESDILKKILEGVEYIHSCGIMHRDLKPSNIFLYGHECHVKIGDFGLACTNVVMNQNDELPSTSAIDGDTGSAHTTGVGTFVYASPEQLEGSHYDSKSDMYSVGVIAVELFQPFGTEMERVRTLGHLRQGKIPDQLSENWPVHTEYIKLLTSSDPSLRPSASHLQKSDLFNNKDMVIHSLQRKVDEQEEEIVQLRKQISELQSFCIII